MRFHMWDLSDSSFARDHLGTVRSSPDCSIAVAQLGGEQPSMRSLEAFSKNKDFDVDKFGQYMI